MNKKVILIVFFIPVFLITQCDWFYKEEIVEIPDPLFLEALIEEAVDTNGDNIISRTEAAAVNSLDISGSERGGLVIRGGIKDVTGLDAFINLDTFSCFANSITELDISNNKKLKVLDCEANSLIQLNVASNNEIEVIYCAFNKLTSLDLSMNNALRYLDCIYNQISSLDVLSNANLIWLICNNNKLNSIDISNNLALKYFYCSKNQLQNLDVSNNVDLIKLSCGHNQLSSLDVSKNILLEHLYCPENQFSKLNLSSNLNLEDIFISSIPSLEEVCVWTMPFPPAGVRVQISYSPNLYFTTDCSDN